MSKVKGLTNYRVNQFIIFLALFDIGIFLINMGERKDPLASLGWISLINVIFLFIFHIIIAMIDEDD